MTKMTKTLATKLAKQALQYGRMEKDGITWQKCPVCGELIEHEITWRDKSSAEVCLRTEIVRHLTSGDCGNED